VPADLADPGPKRFGLQMIHEHGIWSRRVSGSVREDVIRIHQITAPRPMHKDQLRQLGVERQFALRSYGLRCVDLAFYHATANIDREFSLSYSPAR
jgi:hypothetical protein